MFSPNGLETAKATRSLDISSDTHDDKWGSFEDGNSLDNFLLVHLRSGLVDITNDVSHTSLESDESGKVNGLGWIILRERFDLTEMTLRALSGCETHVAVARSRELTVTHVTLELGYINIRR